MKESQMRRSIFTDQVVALLAVLVASGTTHAAPLGTAFTYQGQLKQSGAAVNGASDFKFSLWDADTAGNQIGITLTFDGAGADPAPINIVNGLFTAQLDFGNAPSPFTAGAARWLKIEVRSPSGMGVYMALSPRQPVTLTPFAQFAQTLADNSVTPTK